MSQKSSVPQAFSFVSQVLKRDTVAHDLCADLDQLVLQARQRPVFDRLRRRQRAQEISEIVGERMKLKSHRVGGERPARQPRPFDRAFAFLDPSLASGSWTKPRRVIAKVEWHSGELYPRVAFIVTSASRNS